MLTAASRFYSRLISSKRSICWLCNLDSLLYSSDSLISRFGSSAALESTRTCNVDFSRFKLFRHVDFFIARLALAAQRAVGPFVFVS